MPGPLLTCPGAPSQQLVELAVFGLPDSLPWPVMEWNLAARAAPGAVEQACEISQSSCARVPRRQVFFVGVISKTNGKGGFAWRPELEASSSPRWLVSA